MSARARSHGGTRQLFAIGVAMLAMLMMGIFQPAGAQADPVSCGFFETQEDAQAALDAHPEDAVSLDADGNGVACEGVFEQGPPPVFDPASCGHYGSQASAQEDLEAHPEYAASLDADGNGIACEGVFETVRPTVVVCNEALGTLIEVSEEALEQGTLDFPYHRAAQAEIAAGTCAAAYPVEPTVVVCNEALGTLLEISQDALDQGLLDFPSRLATQAEIAAGECAVTSEVPRAPTVVICDQSRGRLLDVSPEMLEQGTRSFPSRRATEAEIAASECPVTSPVTPGEDGKPGGNGKPGKGMVTSLPSTGTGAPDEQGTHASLVAVAVPLALILTGLALQLRNRRPLA